MNPPAQTLTDSEKWALLAQSNAPRAAHDLSAQPDKAAEITGELGVAYMVEVVSQLRSDAAADLIRSLPPDFGAQVIEGLRTVKRSDVREILSYPPDSAGSMMAKECLYVHEGMTVADAIEYLHLLPEERKARNPYVYVLDEARRPVGWLEVQDLVLTPLYRDVSEIQRAPVPAVPSTATKDQITKTIQADRHLEVPVVDTAGALLGVISADNAVQAVQEKADAAIAQLVGTGAEEMKSIPVPKILRLRLPWLLVNLLSGLACALIAEIFQNDGRTLAVLFLFIPVILGISESTGIQGATIVVRRTTLGRVDARDIGGLFLKEVFVGILIGIVCGLAVGAITSLWQGSPLLGVAIAASMACAVIISAVTGLALPLIFKAVRIDPAIASGPLVLAICDLQTLFIYFNLSNFILQR